MLATRRRARAVTLADGWFLRWQHKVLKQAVLPAEPSRGRPRRPLTLNIDPQALRDHQGTATRMFVRVACMHRARKEVPMKLTAAQIERTASQLEAQPIPDKSQVV